MPLDKLLVLSTTAFLTILTETMPAAVMPAMAEGLKQSPAGIGLLVSVYALASAAAAIPIVALTRTLPRKPLYIALVLSFAIANTITALSSSYALTLASRVVAGLAAGIIWPVICGYAMRLVAAENMGRAVAITLAGSTVAMVAGLPLGTALGDLLGWRYSYGLLSLVALLVIAWVLACVPPAPGEHAQARASIRVVVRTPGLRPILLATLCAILAHYTLYTYMAPLAQALRLPRGTAQGLLLFGAGALVGVLMAGRLVDQRQRTLAMTALTCTAIMMLILSADPHLVLACVALFAWGTSFGVMPTIFQSATGRVATGNAELATAMLVTIYNLGIFGGGAMGGLLLGTSSVAGLELFSLISVCLSLAVVAKSVRHAFPGQPASSV
ncbi:MFS transporter [Frateuria defendens]|uniref:MFS transporter n=1 Tax=Frateuria defendens TaxID=2219559 RepID=UPI0013793AAE|nr:MFS transporter [Frateuria defendens]